MYKNLNLKREGMDKKIKEYFDNVLVDDVEIEIKTINHYQELFIIHFKARKEILFDLYLKENGKYTFNFTQHGTSDATREEFLYPMANWLIETHSFGIIDTNLVIGNISKEDFEIIIEFISEENKENSFERREIPKGVQYKIKSKYRDILSLTHFASTNKLLIQGRPLYLYWKTVMFILDYHYISEEEAIVMVNTSDNPKDKTDIDKIIQEKYSILYENLNDDLKKFLSVYIVLKDNCVEGLPDYSYICFPVFKISEGFLRQILSDELLNQEIYLEEKGFSIDLQNSKIVFKNGSLFYLKDENYFLINDIGGIDANKRDKINNLYTYFHKQRHSCSHGKEDNGSRVIESIGEACHIGDNLLKLINNFFE